MKNKITNVAWLDAGNVGIVRIETPYSLPSYYIKAFISSKLCIRNEERDAIEVANWGYKISDSIGESIIKEYGKPFEVEYN